jgi:methylated-DNA-[protein]-cysteine S-methyltransferase
MRYISRMGGVAGNLFYTKMESMAGPLVLAGNSSGLRRIHFANGGRFLLPEDWKQDAEPFGEVIRQLRAYFSGELKEFNVPLALEGTPFQMRVWNSLRTIPYGRTISYAQLAQEIGNPKAVRAVGLANGCNPVPIVIPCHRVIGSNGKLTGFGGGLPAKKALLALESRQRSFLEA